MSQFSIKYWIAGDEQKISQVKNDINLLEHQTIYINIESETIENDAYITIILSNKDESKGIELSDLLSNISDKSIHNKIIDILSSKQQVSRLIYDQVSEYLATSSYPNLYKLENSLREFLVRYFRKILGSEWDSEEHRHIYKSTIKRKKQSYDNHDNIFYQMDFIDLKNIICTRFPLRENYELNELVRSQDVNTVSIARNQIEEFIPKSQIDHFMGSVGNFFTGLSDDWNKLYSTRNKIAHNKQITI